MRLQMNECKHYTIAPSSGLNDTSLISTAVMGIGEFVRISNQAHMTLMISIKDVIGLQELMVFFRRVSIACYKKKKKNSKSQCHFYLSGEIAFPIKVRNRLLTEPWLLLQSLWDNSTDNPAHPIPLPCILLNLHTKPMHRQSHKQARAKPRAAPQSVFPHQIHKTLPKKKNPSPLCTETS